MANQKIVFERVNWSPEVAANLAKAIAPEQDFIENEVKQGISECWHVHGFGYLVTRLELDIPKTLVIVAGQGQGLKKIMSIMPSIAKSNKAKWIRVHSRRSGMAKLLQPLGYLVEYGLGENIYYKKVA
jgi:hypothetical protein